MSSHTHHSNDMLSENGLNFPGPGGSSTHSRHGSFLQTGVGVGVGGGVGVGMMGVGVHGGLGESGGPLSSSLALGQVIITIIMS